MSRRSTGEADVGDLLTAFLWVLLVFLLLVALTQGSMRFESATRSEGASPVPNREEIQPSPPSFGDRSVRTLIRMKEAAGEPRVVELPSTPSGASGTASVLLGSALKTV
jgi:hypothetical protein